MPVDNLKFYLSTESPCSYLPDQQSASLFADPEGPMNTDIYSILINFGFRRSANFVYRPHCTNCSECKSTRIPVDLFQPSRNQKRVLKKNANVVAIETQPELKESHFNLYKKYIRARHAEGEMDHDNEARYFEFLNSDWCNTRFVEFSLNNQLIAVATIDYLKEGISALYTFFDPDYDYLSPGTYAVLWQIEKARALKKKYVYLGYWIRECNKMNYKIKFQPIEIFEEEVWHYWK